MNCSDGTWLASLEDPSTKQLIYFKSIEELFEFLKDRPAVAESQAIKKSMMIIT
jgi:hypothetical protein